MNIDWQVVERIGYPIFAGVVLLSLVIWVVKAIFGLLKDELSCIKEILRKEVGYPLAKLSGLIEALLKVESVKQERKGNDKEVKKAVKEVVENAIGKGD